MMEKYFYISDSGRYHVLTKNHSEYYAWMSSYIRRKK